MIRFAPERALLQSRWMRNATPFSVTLLAAERRNSPTQD